MRKPLFTACALALLLALAGCETTVDVTPPDHTPRLSLLYTLGTLPTTGDPRLTDGRALYVSTSQPALASTPLQGRADAHVELRDASGQVVEEFRPKARTGYPDSVQGYYVATRGFVGQPGQRYTLQASAPGVAPTQASLTLPAPASVDAGSFVPDATNPTPYPEQYVGRLAFSLHDAPGTANYYLLYARVLDADGNYWGQVYQDSYSPSDGPDVRLLRLDLSDPDGFYRIKPASDEGRDGQVLRYSSDVHLNYNPSQYTQPPVPAPAFVEVVVSTLPADTYLFYQSVQRYYDTDGNPFAEPAPLRGNLTDGYGLFGGATDVRYRIAL